MVTQSTLVLSCQKCGGNTEAVAGQDYYHCRYCTSLLIVKDVSVDRIVPTGTLLEHSCPVCSQAMQTGLIEKQRALYCMTCYGVLLRHGDFGTIVAERRARRAGMEPAEPRPIPEGAYARRIECPTCQKTMDTHPYYGPGNVVVDTCVDCGFVWLDHGELKRIEDASWTRAADPSAWTTAPLTDEARIAEVTLPPKTDEVQKHEWVLDLADVIFGVRS